MYTALKAALILLTGGLSHRTHTHIYLYVYAIYMLSTRSSLGYAVKKLLGGVASSADKDKATSPQDVYSSRGGRYM